MESRRKAMSLLLTGVLFAAGVVARAASNSPDAKPLKNWAAPPSWSPAARTGFHLFDAKSDTNGPVPFIPITPCRQYDSRSATPLATGVDRTVTLTGVPCGIAQSAVAVSVNITIFNITGAGSNGVFKVDTVSPPVTAWINYPPTETQRGNAGVLPLTGGGEIIVQVAQGAGSVDFTVDTNGYYASSPANESNFLLISNNSAQFTIQGINTSTSCVGVCGLYGVVNSGTAVRGQTLGTANGTVGVEGLTGSVSGRSYGVLGISASSSFDSAGVRGVDSTGPPATIPIGGVTAGVIGDSLSNVGVWGRSRFNAVAGNLYDSSGGSAAAGELGTTFGTAADTTTGPWGVFAFGTIGATGAKHFVEPHPADPSKVIVYSSLEGREVGTYFRGTAHTISGRAVIEIPEDFRIVTDEEGLTVQLTPIRSFASMYVENEDLNQIVVRSSKDITFHYLVQGVRRAYKSFEPVGKGYEFMPRSADQKMPAYLTEEAKRRLVANGTYNSDGTVNRATAERLGWARMWAERQEEAEAAAKSFARQRAVEKAPPNP